jgi:hypothetical protein
MIANKEICGKKVKHESQLSSNLNSTRRKEYELRSMSQIGEKLQLL